MRRMPRLIDALRNGFFYAALGPFVGLAAVLVLLFTIELIQAPELPDWEGAGSLLIGAPVLIFFSYVFGIVPAFLTGLVAGPLARHRTSLWYVPVVGLLGGCIAGACALPFALGRAAGPDFGVTGLLAGPGFIAAAFCAWRQRRSTHRFRKSEPDSACG